LLVMLVGFVGAFGLPQKMGISTDQLILGLLAAVGLELLMERVGLLGVIRESQLELKQIVQPSLSADALFLTRSDPPAFDAIVSGAHEVWVAGKSLNSLLATHGSIILSSGVKFRFLVHDPSVAHLAQSMASQSFSNPSVDNMKAGIRSGLAQLSRIAATAADRVEVRLSPALMPNGFTIVNPGDRDEWMRVELFSFQVSLSSRRSLILVRKRDPKIYSFYFDQYTGLWASSKPLQIPTNQNVSAISGTVNE